MDIKNLWSKEEIDKEKLKQSEELFMQVMTKALEGKQSGFEFITCWQVRNVVKEYIVGVDTVISIFSDLERTFSDSYIKQIIAGEQDLEVILSLKQFNQCRKYYEQEKAIAEDMLAEYRSYIWGGHIWDTLVGNTRKEEDLVDYRTLPIKWF